MKRELYLDGQEKCLQNFQQKNGEISFELEGESFHFRCINKSSHSIILECLREGQRFHLTFERRRQSGNFLVEGKSFSIASAFPTKARTQTAGTLNDEKALDAPMPGKILKIMVSEGQQVKKGDSLLVMEAMKMEHTLKAPRAGKIKTLFFQVGEQVQADKTLLELEEA